LQCPELIIILFHPNLKLHAVIRANDRAVHVLNSATYHNDKGVEIAASMAMRWAGWPRFDSRKYKIFFFCTGSRLCGPSSILPNGYQIFFTGRKGGTE
jgi:hypothetical protein